MPNQMLANTITRVLSYDWISKVKFTMDSLFGSLRVNGFQLVVNAIAQGQITCEVGVPSDLQRPRGFYGEARYVPESRQLCFPNEQYGSSSYAEMYNMVHEATHALFDCQYGTKDGTQILAMDDEAAAFLAQALYSRVAFRNSPSAGWNMPLIEGDPIAEALHLVDTKLRPDAANPPYRVQRQDLDQLLLSIQRMYKLAGSSQAGIRHVYYGLPGKAGRPPQGIFDEARGA